MVLTTDKITLFYLFISLTSSTYSLYVYRITAAPDHTQTHTNTHSIWLFLDKLSALRRDLYLTTHNIHDRHLFSLRNSNPQSQQARGHRKIYNYYIFWVCVSSLRHTACNGNAPYCHLWPAPLYHIFPHYLIIGTIFRRKKKSYWTWSVCLIFSTISARNSSHSKKKWARCV